MKINRRDVNKALMLSTFGTSAMLETAMANPTVKAVKIAALDKFKTDLDTETFLFENQKCLLVRVPIPEKTGNVRVLTIVARNNTTSKPSVTPVTPAAPITTVIPAKPITPVAPVMPDSVMLPAIQIPQVNAISFTAYSMACTHSGCTVKTPDKEHVLSCGCHGSEFDSSGKVVAGPARRDLRSIQLEVRDQDLWAIGWTVIPA